MNIMSGLFVMTKRYWKLWSRFDNQNIISLPRYFCYRRHYLPTTRLTNSKKLKIEGKINGRMTTKTVSMTYIWLVYWFKYVWVVSRKTLNTTWPWPVPKKLHNKSYELKQTIYHRIELSNEYYKSVVCNDNQLFNNDAVNSIIWWSFIYLAVCCYFFHALPTMALTTWSNLKNWK